jgi:hypothetical protein
MGYRFEAKYCVCSLDEAIGPIQETDNYPFCGPENSGKRFGAADSSLFIDVRQDNTIQFGHGMLPGTVYTLLQYPRIDARS